MQKVGLNQVQAVFSSNNTSVAPAPQVTQAKVDSSNKLKYALAGLAAAGVAIVAGVGIYRHQNAAKAASEAQEQMSKLLNEINFNKGVATVKDTGEKFTGVINHTLNNGDKVTMKYKDGVIQESTREGSVAVKKVFEKLENGTHKVTINQNGKIDSVIPEDLRNAAIKKQEDLKTFKDLIENKDNYTRKEFIEQCRKLQQITEAQTEELNTIIDSKPYSVDEITFGKTGRAYIEDNILNCKPFSVETVAPNGDKIVMEYNNNGVLTKSTRTGKQPFIKTYEPKDEIIGGIKKVTIDDTKGKVEVFDVVQKQNEVLTAQELIKDGINQSQDLDTLKALSKNQYCSNVQKEQLDRKIAKLEDLQAQKEAERIALDAKEKANAKFIDISNPKENIGTYNVIDYIGLCNGEYNNHKYKPTYELELFKQNKDLTLDSQVNLFSGINGKNFYDLPERMAIAADNSLRTKGNAYICDNIPELFKGCDSNEVCKSVSNFLNTSSGAKYNKINIGGKEILTEKIGGGCIGTVYKFSDNAGNAVVIKKYNQPSLLHVNCGLQEIATSRQANKDGVVNIPKFFMANTVGYKTTPVQQENSANKYIADSMWMMSEYIDNGKKSKTGLKLENWMKQYGLRHGDKNGGAIIGDYIVDLGGILPTDINGTTRENWNTFLSDSFMKSLTTDGFSKIIQTLNL